MRSSRRSLVAMRKDGEDGHIERKCGQEACQAGAQERSTACQKQDKAGANQNPGGDIPSSRSRIARPSESPPPASTSIRSRVAARRPAEQVSHDLVNVLVVLHALALDLVIGDETYEIAVALNGTLLDSEIQVDGSSATDPIQQGL